MSAFKRLVGALATLRLERGPIQDYCDGRSCRVGRGMPVIVQVKGQRKSRLVTQDNGFRLKETPQQVASRLVQEYGLAERAAEFVHGRLQEHPAGDSRHEHWRQVMQIVQRVRRRKMERRHLIR